ncbi:MSCRAMM family protein [Ruminococcus sp.]|uniref:MSCRAMM family protein n=1 Tax=Ruminococcus sp. TaxID=41978 RepID=UPI002E76FDC4|nr:prealbumin-like fold domain-containing protein [Ruminococcus sp.]MEE1262911.1 prealbumin-like fold domain-containing protein [Ruminococcus sp.]
MKHGINRGKDVKEKKPKRYRQSGDGRIRSSSLSRILKRTFGLAAALVVFVTAYAMVLPAITISVPECGIEEHSHTDECYRIEKTLKCSNTDEDHIHTDDCYDIQRILECEKELHTHTDECYEKNSPTDPDGKSAEEVGIYYENSSGISNADLSAYKDFEEYLNGVGGKIESLLYDDNNCLLDNVYEASGSGYTFLLRMSSPKIVPDTYFYYLPKGINVDFTSRTGDISNGTSTIGTYTISDDSTYILFTFSSESMNYQNISGQITLSASFEGRISASVQKSGWLISPEGIMDGYFHFNISAKIPADREGLPERRWSLLDRSEITNPWIQDFSDPEKTKDLKITISYGNVKDYELHDISEVYNNPKVQIAYFTDSDTKELILANRCTCDDAKLCLETENGKCVCTELNSYPGWCTCWCLDENATLDISYKNAVNGADGTYILQNQNEIENTGPLSYENKVSLTGTYRNASGQLINDIKKATASIEFGSLVDKREMVIACEEGEYESEFRIALNKEKADFSKFDVDGDGQYDKHVVISDVMNNLKYIAGSMKITAEDADGNQFELIAGTDFNVDVKQTDTGAEMEISLRKLGRYTYFIVYKTKVFSEDTDKTVEISNSVTLKLYDGNNPSYRYTRKFAYSEQWDYLKYEVRLLKVDYEDHSKHLEGAVYGLYAADGTLMAERTTDKDGKCVFATNTVEGLIFSTNTMYYLKEISPPEGYDINITPYWFYFSETRDSTGERKLETAYPGINIAHVAPNEKNTYIAEMELTDEKCFVLPETGGDGTAVFVIAGAALIAAAAGCFVIRKKLKTGYMKN